MCHFPVCSRESCGLSRLRQFTSRRNRFDVGTLEADACSPSEYKPSMCQWHPSFSMCLLSVKVHLLDTVVQRPMVKIKIQCSEGSARVTKPLGGVEAVVCGCRYAD